MAVDKVLGASTLPFYTQSVAQKIKIKDGQNHLPAVLGFRVCLYDVFARVFHKKILDITLQPASKTQVVRPKLIGQTAYSTARWMPLVSLTW